MVKIGIVTLKAMIAGLYLLMETTMWFMYKIAFENDMEIFHTFLFVSILCAFFAYGYVKYKIEEEING